jgi:Glyoxalase-like domain
VAVQYQLVINCVGDPERLARFWAEALGYQLEPPPVGFTTWDDWRQAVGLPESWLGRGTDCIIDPDGAGPRIWIQVVPDPKTTSNRLHIDIHASGPKDQPIEARKARVDAEARQLCELGATLLSDLSAELEAGVDHYAVALLDPEGNEFDIN